MFKAIKIATVIFAVAFAFIYAQGAYAATAEKAAVQVNADKMVQKAPKGAVDVKKCYECHDKVAMLHKRGAHKDVNCVYCHDVKPEHLSNPSPETRPVTNMDWHACGQCHKIEEDTFMNLDESKPARFEKSNQGGRAPNPAWEKLMSPHGFVKEHAATRSHSVMLIDQFIVDRSFGGRFQGKNGWNYIFQTGKVWDVLKDTHPEIPNQKVFMRQTATANNPVCMECKTADQILDWAYMGDPVKGAKWSRASNPVDMAKHMQHGLNCFMCHDPHSAEPRIIRDALINTMTNPLDKDNLYQQDPNRVKIQVIDMGDRGFTRKIAILDRNNPRYKSLQCAQCHVEYNCNPGMNPKTKKPYTMKDQITNHFPFEDALHLYDHYFNKINFQDYTNMFDGAPLWKAQHPDSETFYNSKHDKAGVTCADCHTPSIRDSKGKLQYTTHFAQTPKNQLAQTCLTSKCHGIGADKNWDPKKYSPDYIKVSTNWSAKDAIYSIDSIKGYTTGKMRKAEFWLVTLIDTINQAQIMGVDPAIIKKAQTQHSKAHVLWEYWTAENSDGFHNPALARESLTKSIDESMAGYKLVEDALKNLASHRNVAKAPSQK